MEELLRFLPSSLVSLVGLAAIMVVLIMIGTVAQEWGKVFYRYLRGAKEKRHNDGILNAYDGFERRAESKTMEQAVTHLVDAIAIERREMAEFISSWKEYRNKMLDDIDEIRRKQERNWTRLFDEEIPSIRRS